MSTGQFNLGGIDGVDGLQAIHPSQLNIGTTGSSSERSQTMELLSMQPGSYNMSGMTSPVQNNNTMTSLSSSPYISSIMSDPCNLFSGNMDYGVIGTSDQPDTKDGLEELCPVCGDKVGRQSQLSRVTLTFLFIRCPDTITVSSPVSPARDSSRGQFRTRRFTPVWLTGTVLLIRRRGRDARTADSRNVSTLG